MTVFTGNVLVNTRLVISNSQAWDYLFTLSINSLASVGVIIVRLHNNLKNITTNELFLILFSYNSRQVPFSIKSSRG